MRVVVVLFLFFELSLASFIQWIDDYTVDRVVEQQAMERYLEKYPAKKALYAVKKEKFIKDMQEKEDAERLEKSIYAKNFEISLLGGSTKGAYPSEFFLSMGVEASLFYWISDKLMLRANIEGLTNFILTNILEENSASNYIYKPSIELGFPIFEKANNVYIVSLEYGIAEHKYSYYGNSDYGDAYEGTNTYPQVYSLNYRVYSTEPFSWGIYIDYAPTSEQEYSITEWDYTTTDYDIADGEGYFSFGGHIGWVF